MRYFCVLFLGAAILGTAADFTKGQAARAVIGQDLFTAAKPGGTNWRLGGASGLAYTNGTLIVADSNRIGASPVDNRVLIYHNIAGQFPPQTQEHKQGGRCPACGGAASVVLGQPDFTTTDAAATQTGLSLPTAVATDGTMLAVADTLNNRVLIWKTIPATYTPNKPPPADIVIGQPDFTTTATLVPPTAKSMRGPQGVWFQGGKLYVADTQDHRVLIYNSIPTSNGAAADLVLGQPNFTTFVEPDLTQAKSDATANNLLNPVSVTSDGVRLYVTDLGHNRVLIWNSIPTQNQQPADVVLGQQDMTSAIPNNAFTGLPATDSTDKTNKETPAMCTQSNGTDPATNPTYPFLCESTMSFPRYALSDGHWLFVADGGNDRVMVYKDIPTTNGKAADVILGQADSISDVPSAATDRMQTPTSLAWDSENLFVADTYNRRVVIYSLAEPSIPAQGVLNFASLEVFALGVVSFGGTINEKDEVTVTIGGTDYKYTVVKNDTFDNVVNALVNSINGANSGKGDANVFAAPNTSTQSIVLTARKGGTDGNSVTLATTLSASAKITATASGATLNGGQNTAQVGPATLITIYAIPGQKFSDTTVSAPSKGLQYLPNELAGTRVYIDGSRAPLLYVSPTEIHAQLPGFADTSSVSLYVWTRHADHTVTVTTPVSVTIVPENPGIFATGSKEPRTAVMFHGSPYASGTISVDGTVNAGDVGTITIAGKDYKYTVLSTDTDLEHIRDGLIAAVNKDPKVIASRAGVFTRIILQAKVAGKPGEGITYSATVSSGAKLLLTASGSKLCCDNTGPVTASSPAIPGETVTIHATGLGLVKDMTSFKTGKFYPNGRITEPLEFVSSLAGGKTANVLQATPMPGMVGVFEVQLELNSDLPADQQTQLTIAQNIFVSNIVTFPVTGTVSTPVASPVAGTYSGAQKVSLTAASSTSIYYTTNGVNPTCSGTGTLYSGAISVSSTETIKAIGCRTNWNDSAVLKAVYTIT